MQMGQQQRRAVNEPRCGRRNVIPGSLRANAALSHDTKNFACGLLISTADFFTLHLFLLRSLQSDSTRRRDVFGTRAGLLAKDFPPQIICASIGWLEDAALLSRPRHTSVHLNILHTDVRSPLILAVQPGPDSTVLSAQPSRAIFSPLHRKQIGLLHLCLGPDCISLLIPHCRKHSFFFTVTFSTPLFHAFAPPSSARHLPPSPGGPSLPFARAASFLGIKSHPALMSARTSHLRSGCKAPRSTRATTLH